MRDWQLHADKPLALRFAADTRLIRTDYIDDQSWELVFGGTQEPALAVQTKYGGRAGLVRFVPMFVIDGRSVYETVAFAERPTLRFFAPNYAQVSARLTNTLALTFDLWVMESRAVGGRFRLDNQSDKPLTLRLELYAQAVRNDKSVEMNLLGLDDGTEALHMGRIGNLNPVLMLEKSNPQPGSGRFGERASPKLTSTVTIMSKSSVSLRWVHAGLTSLNESLQAAHGWIARVDWDTQFRKIATLNDPLPLIETGNPDWDAVFAFSNQVLLRSFISATNDAPYPSVVSARTPGRGFSARPDGSDHGYQWNGLTVLTGYFALPSAAILAPELAKGAIKNVLTAQESDGAIDFKPGLGGQRARMLSLPLWASTVWAVVDTTEDKAFAAECLPALRRFFERWFQPDMDEDGDGIPEWRTTAQSGYPENPAFARFRRWAQNADIDKVEAPDLNAYLIAEGQALLKLGELVGDTTDAARIQGRIETLKAALQAMWSEEVGSYLYRDRDTDTILRGVHLFRGKGDEAFDVKTPLNPPNRLILRIIGGRDTAPRTNVIIEGIDAKGNPTSESVPSSAFAWYYGMGAAVSTKVYSQINYLKFEGIIRLYTVEVDTIDLTRQNLTQLLPLWAGVPDEARRAQILKTLTDPQRYWRAFGLPICPANDPAFVANNDGGSGGVWLIWNLLILEALIDQGAWDHARTLINRVLDALIKALRNDRAFRSGYNSETGDGLGDMDELEGTFPLRLLMKLIGLNVISPRKVWAGGAFLLPNPVKITFRGVEVTRSPQGTTVKFPSGAVVNGGKDWVLIEDPTPVSPVETVTPPTEPSVIPPAPPSDLPDDAPVKVTQMPEISPDSSDGAVIPVQAKKDDTMEIAIKQIDYGAPGDTPKVDSPIPPENRGDTPPSSSSGTIRVPIRKPKS